MTAAVPASWRRGVPAALESILPGAPQADTRLSALRAAYEYKLISLSSSANGSNTALRTTLLVRCSGGGGDVQPLMLAQDVRARCNARWAQTAAANPVMRFQDDDAYMLHDRRYKCDSAPGCGASMRIRAWAAAPTPASRDTSKTPRTCAHCGRKGHRKQSCCEAPGNCRLEIDWAHNHPVAPPAPGSSPPPPPIDTALPNGKRPAEPLPGAPVKKSRPDAAATPAMSQMGATCAGGAGCACGVAKNARSRCATALRKADEAVRALGDAVQALAAAHDDLSRKVGEGADELCGVQQLKRQRDALRKEVDDLWAQRSNLVQQVQAAAARNVPAAPMVGVVPAVPSAPQTSVAPAQGATVPRQTITVAQPVRNGIPTMMTPTPVRNGVPPPPPPPPAPSPIAPMCNGDAAAVRVTPASQKMTGGTAPFVPPQVRSVAPPMMVAPRSGAPMPPPQPMLTARAIVANAGIVSPEAMAVIPPVNGTKIANGKPVVVPALKVEEVSSAPASFARPEGDSGETETEEK